MLAENFALTAGHALLMLCRIDSSCVRSQRHDSAAAVETTAAKGELFISFDPRSFVPRTEIRRWACSCRRFFFLPLRPPGRVKDEVWGQATEGTKAAWRPDSGLAPLGSRIERLKTTEQALRR